MSENGGGGFGIFIDTATHVLQSCTCRVQMSRQLMLLPKVPRGNTLHECGRCASSRQLERPAKSRCFWPIPEWIITAAPGFCVLFARPLVRPARVKALTDHRMQGKGNLGMPRTLSIQRYFVQPPPVCDRSEQPLGRMYLQIKDRRI